jgi:deazaflavin-dependent oxidoreductase (nitroreductase family)
MLSGDQVVTLISNSAPIAFSQQERHSRFQGDHQLEEKERQDKMFSDRIRIFNKYVTNRLLRGLANASHGPFAILRHIGRRSGKPYETVIMVWPLGEGFVIALTYGPKVDWYRNMLAAGGCTLLWHQRVYAVGKPELIPIATALPAFPAPLRPLLHRSVQHYVWVKPSASEIVNAASHPT